MVEPEKARKILTRPHPDAKAMRPSDAAKYIGVSLSHLWGLIKKSELNTYKLSEKITVLTKEDLDNYIAQKVSFSNISSNENNNVIIDKNIPVTSINDNRDEIIHKQRIQLENMEKTIARYEAIIDNQNNIIKMIGIR